MPDRPQGELPRITFVAAGDEVAETPRGSAPIVAYLMERFGLVPIAKDLLGDKHHGLAIEHIILIFLLYAAYGATSVKALKENAQRDRGLARLLEDAGIETIEDHVLRYFRRRHSVQTQEALLERFVLHVQDIPRFESRVDGIIALDDCTMEKFGKHMEHIAVVFDHCEKRFCLGYVVVSTCYCDNDKIFPVSFEFRIRTQEEQRRAEEAKIKKEAGIDFRRKDSFPKWLQALEKENRLPTLFSLTGKQASVENFKTLDARNSIWVATAQENLPLRDLLPAPQSKSARQAGGGKREWYLENLKRKTLANKPDVCEGEGFRIYAKEVTLHKYEPEVDFVVVTDLAGQEIKTLILQRVPRRERTARILKFFEREDEPEANKLHIGLRLIKRAKEEIKIKAENVAVDAWFFVVWFVNALLEIPGIKRVVSKLRVDQMVQYNGKWLRAAELWELPGLGFRHDRKNHFKWAKLKVGIDGIGQAAVVLVRELDKNRPWRIISEYIIVCTDPDWAAQKIVAAYKLRWGIEVFYRAAKQRFGMAQFHDEKFAAIHFHMTFVFLGYLLTAVLRHTTPNLEEFTLGEIIDRYLRTLVRIKKKGRNIVVYLGPGFLELFGNLPPPLPP